MATQPNHYISPEEYLDIERHAVTRSEYFHGVMYAMAGGSPQHNRLVSNLNALLWVQTRGKGCFTMSSDMRIKVPETGFYTYADVSVVCGNGEYESGDVLLNPTLVIEVLYPSTAYHDRGFKLQNYQRIASLKYYMLVSQERMLIDTYSRRGDEWTHDVAGLPHERILLPEIGCELLMSDVYEGLTFSGQPAT